jgi:hypothetical protein
VWVIDAKRYQGQVARKDVGGWFSTEMRLYVGRRNCTKLVEAMAKQVDAVRTVLAADRARCASAADALFRRRRMAVLRQAVRN